MSRFEDFFFLPRFEPLLFGRFTTGLVVADVLVDVDFEFDSEDGFLVLQQSKLKLN